MASQTGPSSGTSTPRVFTGQAASAEELLKSQTVGLVHLADFRKRRADVLEQKEKEAREVSAGPRPQDVEDSDGAVTRRPEQPLKKKKKAAKGLLSFGEEEGEDESTLSTPASKSPRTSAEPSPEPSSSTRKFTPNPNSTLPPPRVMTKAALAADAAAREKLRREFLEIQEAVKQTEIAMPFVFYDGANIPGGTVKVKKGDHIWLFLDRCRKLGAELGVSGSGASLKSREDSRRQWARVGVDDLMCVRGEVIVPHHYEFYYFIANKIPDPTRKGRLLFDYSGTTPRTRGDEGSSLPRAPAKEELEGQNDDPTLTKVVDRRWYEKNKHIYPASVWKEFKAGKEFEEIAKGRRDAQGNAFFFG
ncbi:hypothetical protein A1O3_05264 [Capronia epimyces CBS 606.96]|uniref:FAM50A/XAP5 C-terminal domain-containing protein n=1 Tax=Capronia epimyces CBS 606.96 TaxID=1182542 RepID=W9YQP3_9EURO|nr:uncharacterized protein A1O3_05264 [Capronia epimyces CBS 606.96]EXJ84594.1 hypothetical protein A1O3_05264 [Capronia epimyces CBS 606.96]